MLKTTQILTVTPEEVARVDAEVNELAASKAALTGENTQLKIALAAAHERIEELEQGTSEPPPPPPPPPTSNVRLYTDGGTLRTKKGTPVVLRGIELMYGSNAHGVGPAELCNRLKALGANALGPLFQPGTNSVAHVKALCDAARAAGLIVGINADHAGGRAWINTPDMVALCNGYDHVYLQNEIETDPSNPTDDQWQAAVTDLVMSYRNAGHKSLVKVGAPQGGRRVGFPLRRGAAVRAADPEHNVAFSWQAYWEASTEGWDYQSGEGFADGLAGTLQAIRAVAQSGLCFIVGLDWRDDIGLTGWPELAAECQAQKVSFQHWVLTNDGRFPENNILGHWNLSLDSITPTGRQIQQTLLAQRVFADL